MCVILHKALYYSTNNTFEINNLYVRHIHHLEVLVTSSGRWRQGQGVRRLVPVRRARAASVWAQKSRWNAITPNTDPVRIPLRS